MANKKETTNTEETTTKETTKKKLTKSEIKLLLKTAEIDIVSNDKAQLVYKCPRTFQEIYLDEYGDTESVSIDLLQSMKSKARDFFSKYWIVLESVYVPNSDADVTVEDVYNYLGLSSVYENIKDFDEDYFNNILKLPFDDFKVRVENMDKGLLGQLISIAVELYQNNDFNDAGKMLLMEDITDNEYLFKESNLKTKKNK